MDKKLKEFLEASKRKNFNLDDYLNNIILTKTDKVGVTAKNLEKILRGLSAHYYNEGYSLVTDDIFDIMKEKLEEIDPSNDFLSEVGAPVDNKEKVKLPYPMGSLDKIKPSTDYLDKWKEDFKGPYVVSDKLDGISAQLYITDKDIKLYTRGDGDYGQDISHLVDYIIDKKKLNVKDLELPISIRGELIISRKNFKKVEDKFKNARNAVTGYVNAKKVDKELSKIVDFITYTVIYPEMTTEEQLEYLEKLNFIKNVVEYKIYDYKKLTNEILSKYLEKRRSEGNYEVDGIVVYDSKRSYEHTSGNPEHGFAFKSILSDQYAEAVVTDVIWEPSMDGFLKPKVKINPIELVGVTITYATAFHAKFVEENILGVGAVIKIIRSGDVIPHIMEVIKPAMSGKPKMPDVEYIWDKNHVNILVKDMEKSDLMDVIKAKRMDYFFSVLGVKNISIGILNKLVENDYDNIISILSAKKSELATIEGLGKKIVDKIFENINKAMEDVTLDKLMAASHVFGQGLAERKIKQIVREIPNIMDIKNKKELREKIINIDGFSDITTDKFVDNFDKFKVFYKELGKIYDLDNTKKEEIEIGDKFKNEKIVFTGFRDKELQEYIENNGGKVSTSVSSKTTLVIHADSEKSSSKIDKAKDLEIKIMSKSEFKKLYNI